jgi:copper resistance protein B
MKSQLKRPIPCALALALLLSQNAAAQAIPASAGRGQTSEAPAREQPAVDHAAMGHGSPAFTNSTTSQETQARSQSNVRAKQAKAKRSDKRGKQQSVQSRQKDRPQEQHSGRAGHAMPAQPTAPQAPAASGQAQPVDHAAMGHGSPAPAQNTPAQGAFTHDRPAPPSAAQPGRDSPHKEHGAQAGNAMPVQPQPAQQGQAGTTQAPAMDHAAMGHPATGAAATMSTHAGMAQTGQTSGGHDMQMGRMQGGPPPADARDPNAYNEGTQFANLGNHEMNDNAPFWKVLVDKAEAAKGDGERGQNVELEAWYGNDYNKAWVKVEGERRGGTLEAARTELLWDRAFATFWSTQLGIRHDSGEGKSRDWLAFGVQGLAPYWFETEATAYWRPGSGLAARLNAKYEVLFTPRLILEPEIGANLYSRADPERGTGSGLSDINAGLRLRYEFTRQFAPYVGVTWSRQFGRTADITRQRGGDRSEVQAVAGVRFWF